MLNNNFARYQPSVPFKDSTDTLGGHRVLRFTGRVGDGYELELAASGISCRTTTPFQEIASLLEGRLTAPPTETIPVAATILEASGERGLYGATEVDELIARADLRYATATEMIDLAQHLPAVDLPPSIVARESWWMGFTAYPSGLAGGMVEFHPIFSPRDRRIDFVQRVSGVFGVTRTSYLLLLPIDTPQRALELTRKFLPFR